MAQELLTTFEAEFCEVALVPGKGGVFKVRVGGDTAWSCHERKRFPEIKDLKQFVRDVVGSAGNLGHVDR